MLKKQPAKISILPLHRYSDRIYAVKGANIIVPKPDPLAAKPKAIVLCLSNQNAIGTTAVTKVSPLPMPPMRPKVRYITFMELANILKTKPIVQMIPPRTVILIQP